MQVDDFKRSPVGRLVPISGHDARRGRDYNHWAYVPEPLPDTVDLEMRTYRALGDADRALGALEAQVGQLPNPKLLVRPSLTREAVSTSALEGTFAPLSEVFEARYVDDNKKSAEVREVQNYVDAALRGLELIHTFPVCVRVASELQEILVDRTRGDSNDAGRLREKIVCIGDHGSGIEDSRFVPPPNGAELIAGTSDWEKWVNADNEVPLLVKAALAHYQFETLHPYNDGNGRIGRLLIVLQLIDAGALEYPVLNLSPWFEPRKPEYVDRLLDTSKSGDFNPWVTFFANAVEARSKAACSTIKELKNFREEVLDRLRAVRAKGTIVDVANDLIGYPVLSVVDIQETYSITYPAANSIVAKLEGMGVLREITGGNYRRVYVCDRVRDIVAQY